MSRPDASPEEVMNALEKAQCMDIIEKLPEGINTIIGSEGVYLSGGESQRLCVARAILKDSPVIILDEAAAYSDPDNEKRMNESLKALAKNKTVIMIAHRLSGVRDADVIAVLDDGRIIESGSFDELMTNSGTFRKLWNEYQRSLSWEISNETGGR
jgi:ATP-binding cassette subfamily B protein